jgi:hypothetical protein
MGLARSADELLDGAGRPAPSLQISKNYQPME